VPNHHIKLIIHEKNSGMTYHLATIHPWQTNARWQTQRARPLSLQLNGRPKMRY